MSYCVNWGDLVRVAFEAAEGAPPWAAAWVRKRLAEHLARDRACFRAGACGEDGDSWAFLRSLQGREREAGESIRAAGERLAEKARLRGETPCRFAPPGDIGERVHLVRDWLFALPEAQEGMNGRSRGLIARGKLDRVTFAQAVEASRRWHRGLARRAERETAHAGDAGAVEEVLGLDAGARWVRLLTPEALDREGAAMGHCVGGGGYDDVEILSLRDVRNRPHVTVEVGKEGGFVQVKGRGNGPVAGRHAPAVVALAERLRPPAVADAGLFGHVFVDGRLIPANALPGGLRVAGNLDFSGCAGLESLPENLRVEGSLRLADCGALGCLPDGLSVGGDLWVEGCGRLGALPAGLEVGGDIYLLGCTGIRRLPEGMEAKGSLHLNGCASLEALPEGLRVGGGLHAEGCTGLVALPLDLAVGGTLDLRRCWGIRSIPAGLDVGGSLRLDGCTGLTALPEGLWVRGDLCIPDCEALEGLPEGLRVEGSLWVSGCSRLRTLPDRLRVGGDLLATRCTSLAKLPETLHVGGKTLNLAGCTSLVALPEGLGFKGYLCLAGCTALRSLPAIADRIENLELRGCTALVSLPERLRVARHLRLQGCTGLERLPAAIEVGRKVWMPDRTLCEDVESAREWFAARASQDRGTIDRSHPHSRR